MIIELVVTAILLLGILIKVARRNLKPKDPYYEDWEDLVDTAWDYRDDTDNRGMLVECWYCNTDILIDGDQPDYDVKEPEIHCEDCTHAATRNMCG